MFSRVLRTPVKLVCPPSSPLLRNSTFSPPSFLRKQILPVQRHVVFSNKLRSLHTTPSLSSSSPKMVALAQAGGLMVGSYLLLNVLFNRPSRIVGGSTTLSKNARDYLHGTYRYVFGGLCISAASATVAFQRGLAHRVLHMNKFLYIGTSLAATIGTTMLTLATDHRESPALKHLFWAGSMASVGTLCLSPIAFLPSALIGRAAAYTAGIVGSLSVVAMTAEEGAFLWLGAPLMGGLSVVVLSSLATAFAPAGGTMFRVAHPISLYGGLAVFGGFMLYDTQKILMRGANNYDANPDFIGESYELYYDVINIFIRVVQIVTMQDSRKRR